MNTRTPDVTGTGLLDCGQAAAYLNTSERHVRRLRAEERLGYVKVGGKLRFSRDDLDAYIASNRFEAVAAIDLAVWR
jgi:excisionase family DNA binding protein